LLAVLAACSDDGAPRKQEKREPLPTVRREIEPPSGMARLLPPYVITATEVGPYKLEQTIATLLDRLPKGPRMERFEIPSVVHASLMRAEEGGTVLIGGEPTGTTTFVAVINNSDVARTEHGVHVGASVADLAKLGPLVDDADRAFDPRLVVPAAMRNARFVVTDKRVAAIVILAGGASTTPGDAACPRPKSTETAMGACFAAGGRLISYEHDEIVVQTPEGERVDAIGVENLQFAAVLRNPIDGRDEVVAIQRDDDLQTLRWRIAAWRYDGAKRRFAVEPTTLYTLTAAQTRWIGADLRDIDLYLELASRPDGIEVGGLLTTRAADGKIRDVVALLPATAPRRHPAKPPQTDPGDAGVIDADLAPKSRSDTP
jgi:hypothetical protein